MRTTLWLTLTVCGMCAWQGISRAEESARLPAVVANQPLIQASLDRIARKSPRWRADVAAVQRLGRQVFVLRPNEVVVADTSDGEGRGRFEPDLIAAAAPVADATQRVRRVLVVINVELLEETHRRRGSLQGEFEADLDALIVHEVYGHAVPYLLAGHLSGRCADPVAGQRPEDACAIRRENEVRADLGLFRRTSYNLDTLHLTRRGH